MRTDGNVSRVLSPPSVFCPLGLLAFACVTGDAGRVLSFEFALRHRSRQNHIFEYWLLIMMTTTHAACRAVMRQGAGGVVVCRSPDSGERTVSVFGEYVKRHRFL